MTSVILSVPGVSQNRLIVRKRPAPCHASKNISILISVGVVTTRFANDGSRTHTLKGQINRHRLLPALPISVPIYFSPESHSTLRSSRNSHTHRFRRDKRNRKVSRESSIRVVETDLQLPSVNSLHNSLNGRLTSKFDNIAGITFFISITARF